MILPVGSGRPRRWERATLIVFFAALLLCGAVGKLLDNQGFARLLTDWRVFPPATTPYVGVTLGLLEFTAGLGLLAGGRRRRQGATTAMVLYLLYAALEASALLRHLDIPNTGTFGVYLPARLTGARLIQDALFASLAILLRRLQNRRATDHLHAAAPVRWAARR